ncbi:MAG TPA: helix-turn-helix domain-containing protein [Marmoricola sp.]|jgi:IclR family acetate operon transcriptional repressor|nr:helix-turn-helix domain-containing protein [Marmoricola sp.]
MSSTFLRGLQLLEIVGTEGPIGVSELARRLGADKSGVSRMVAAAERDGWLVRSEEGVRLGARLPVLGYDTPMAVTMREVRPLLDAAAGITGMLAQACGLIGGQVVPVLSSGQLGVQLPSALALPLPIWGTASGRAIAAGLGPDELGRLLPSEPFPEPLSTMSARPAPDAYPKPSPPDAEGWAEPGRRITDRAELDAAIAEVRRTGTSRERGEVHPSLGCIAVAWPSAPVPAAIGLVGPVAEIVASARLIDALLAAVVEPGADRGRIVGVAAALLGD